MVPEALSTPTRKKPMAFSYDNIYSTELHTVTLSGEVQASPSSSVTQLSICVRDENDTNLDFPRVNGGAAVTIGSTPVTLTETGQFPDGTYTWGICFYKDGYWQGEGPYAHTFTVGSSTGEPAPEEPEEPAQPTSPSGVAMPTGTVTRNGKTWTPIFNEDFTTAAPLGQFRSIYNERFHLNNEGESGKYFGDQTVSASGSVMDIFLHHINGADAGVNGRFLNDFNTQWGFVGGRFDIRYRVTGNPAGYGAAFMLWPQNNKWSEGEIDYPEGELTSVQGLNQHAIGANPGNKTQVIQNVANWSDWHTASIEWVPGVSVRYYMDDVLVLAETNSRNVPTTEHAWIIQAAAVDESVDGAPDTSSGHLQVDWAVAYK